MEEMSELAIKRGKRITELRKQKGLSIRGLANTVGMSDTALAKIEKGNNDNIKISTGVKIAKALEVSFVELFEIETLDVVNLQELKEEKHELLKRIEELEEQLDDKRRIIKFLSDNDFTLDIAHHIWRIEEFGSLAPTLRDYEEARIDFGLMPDDGRKRIESPFDPTNKQSQIKYIEAWFDKLLDSQTKEKPTSD